MEVFLNFDMRWKPAVCATSTHHFASCCCLFWFTCFFSLPKIRYVMISSTIIMPSIMDAHMIT